MLQSANAQPIANRQDIFTTPPENPVRTLAEWEELEAIALTYHTEYDTLKKKLIAEIARHAKEEVKVLIFCEGSSSDVIGLVKHQLERKYNLQNQDNLFFVKKDFNKRIWIRDFGAHTVYENEVGERLFIDWMYDHNFENADLLISTETAEFLESDLYTTTTAPYNLKFDGGNFQSDGLGTAIASTHIFDDNLQLPRQMIDQIAEEFMGVSNFIKLKKLPFDVIHHVDMHLKLLDEETLLVGQYPDSIADGPQIEENLKFLTENFKTSFGTDFEIHRIPMPADQAGRYPDQPGTCSAFDKGCYYTYTNAFFINELVLVPTYFGGQGADISALRQWEEMMPGYKIVGIDCSNIIREYGAIHCVTKEIGVKNPLRIIHQKIKEVCETDRTIDFAATLQHVSGIDAATVFYSTDPTTGFQEESMKKLGGEIWTSQIPNFPKGTKVTYFIRAFAKNGKTIARPMPAEKGGWTFEIGCKSSSVFNKKTEDADLDFYPNPASSFIKIESKNANFSKANLLVYNGLGEIFRNEKIELPTDFSVENLPAGIYFFRIENEDVRVFKKVVKN